MTPRTIVIMAGGRGERFWPASRNARPKHLLPIVGAASMLAQTIERVAPVVGERHVFVLTAAEQREALLEACPGLSPEQVVVEPVGRDTAAAVALANLLARRQHPDSTLALLPADHVVHDVAAFRRTLRAAFAAAEAESTIVTIGIRPTRPETGFGYLELGEPWTEFEGVPVQRVRRFVEKPDRATAELYVASGQYLWNGGMFLFGVRTFDVALAAGAPEIAARFALIEAELSAGRPLAETLAEHYPSIPRISVDFAVMEKAPQVTTVPALFDWDDVGAWPAVARHHPADAAGNVRRGRVAIVDGRGNLAWSDDEHVVTLLGVDNLIVVHTADATLVCPADRAQHVKQLLRELESLPGGRRHL